MIPPQFLDKYRQSPFTRTFFSKKIRVTVIGATRFTRQPEATSPEANTCFCGESYSTNWVQEQPLTLPKTSPIWWTLIIGLSPVPPYFEIIQLQYA